MDSQMEYVLSLEHGGSRLYWRGEGWLVPSLDCAKKYPSRKIADYWCSRIKRWNLKVSSVKGENERRLRND